MKYFRENINNKTKSTRTMKSVDNKSSDRWHFLRCLVLCNLQY